LGVTGSKTSFGAELKTFISRVKKQTKLPLAVGFGVSEKADVAAIQNAGGEFAVVGSAILRAYEKGGKEAVIELIQCLS